MKNSKIKRMTLPKHLAPTEMSETQLWRKEGRKEEGRQTNQERNPPLTSELIDVKRKLFFRRDREKGKRLIPEAGSSQSVTVTTSKML